MSLFSVSGRLAKTGTIRRPVQESLIGRILRAIGNWHAKRESRRVLPFLTDDELRDIGITRSEARKEVSKSFFWDQ
ncbi:DUF1127 domain-containing protein [Rhizobium grahamii]|uniref:DUF1127 domain-containing protein n=1 Tax=Rhizobium grahamii TaxID=1120045 RepID=A0A5Q0C2W5_9HYPH|nr:MULTISPECIES: DUF1127 domain-containing protein [Rhizobium]QFY60236.1 DUF1127 domain-containing protein [Rhizobium grahamii]QRM50641.1 DUF1127 domain-containing protein [Rhizobium sp. BG6]